jgi:ADP-heptose:LPS heptosyltransferase
MIENCSGIGDLIMFTPMLRKIKEMYPDYILNILTKKENEFFISRLPYINNIYTIERGSVFSRFRPFIHLFHQDYIVLTTWQPQLAVLAAILQISHRIGVTKKKYCRLPLFHKHINRFSEPTKFIANSIAEKLSYALDVELTLNNLQCEVSHLTYIEQKHSLDSLYEKYNIPKTDYVIIAPYTSGSITRNIPLSLVNEIISHITNKYELDCIIIGQQTPCSESKINMINKKVYNLTGKTSSIDMLSLIHNADFIISADSAPLHIACAMKKYTIGLYGKTSPKQWAPKKYCFPISLNLPCSPCTNEQALLCENKACINNITLKMIVKSISDIYRVVGRVD